MLAKGPAIWTPSFSDLQERRAGSEENQVTLLESCETTKLTEADDDVSTPAGKA